MLRSRVCLIGRSLPSPANEIPSKRKREVSRYRSEIKGETSRENFNFLFFFFFFQKTRERYLIYIYVNSHRRSFNLSFYSRNGGVSERRDKNARNIGHFRHEGCFPIFASSDSGSLARIRVS